MPEKITICDDLDVRMRRAWLTGKRAAGIFRSRLHSRASNYFLIKVRGAAAESGEALVLEYSSAPR
jgi:hypothetical protein